MNQFLRAAISVLLNFPKTALELLTPASLLLLSPLKGNVVFRNRQTNERREPKEIGPPFL
jgi:hypothetical protein